MSFTPFTTRQRLLATELNTAVQSCLPLTGGTLTGPVTGTELTLTGPAAADRLNVVGSTVLGTLEANNSSFNGNVTVSGVLTANSVVTTDGQTVRRIVSGKTGIMIPYYLYPNNPYTDPTMRRLIGLCRQYHDVPLVVVLNPGSGPGTVWDGNYAAAIKLLKAAGATVVGYVSTVYAARPQDEVENDVIAWNVIYADTPVDGIFYDEMPYDPGVDNASVTLYAHYYSFAHLHGYGTVVGNPGTNQQSIWYENATADIIVTWETSSWPSEADMAGNYVGGHGDYDWNNNCVLVHSMPTFDVKTFRQIRRYVKWIYVTDDIFFDLILDNPWDTLASYLEELFAACSDISVPGEGTTVLTYGTDTDWDAEDTKIGRVVLTGDTIINFPTGLIDGSSYTLILEQDGTGGWETTFDGPYFFNSSVTLPLVATASQRTIITFINDRGDLLATSVSTPV